MPSSHSHLPASSAHRWINCPGSIAMAANCPETTSVYAEEGTLAHSMAELLIGIELASTKKETDTIKAKLDALIEEVDEFYRSHDELDGCGLEMCDVLTQYAADVAGRYMELRKKDPAALLMTEVKVDYSLYAPQGWGTSDVIILGGGELSVMDLKYGKGVMVDAANNEQLQLYALGAMTEFGMLYDIESVDMAIIQPRLNHISLQVKTTAALIEWGEKTVKPAARAALSSDPGYCAGPWCKFCPGAGACRCRAEHCLELEATAGKDRAMLTDGELGEILVRAQDLSSWASDLQGYALARAMDGADIDGWKVVEGRSVRRYTDEAAVADAARQAGYDDALLYERKLLTLSALERLMGKKAFSEACGQYVVKPEGRPTLVPRSDTRKELTLEASKKTDFTD